MYTKKVSSTLKISCTPKKNPFTLVYTSVHREDHWLKLSENESSNITNNSTVVENLEDIPLRREPSSEEIYYSSSDGESDYLCPPDYEDCI